MAIDKKYHYKHKNTLRDLRTPYEKVRDYFVRPQIQYTTFIILAVLMFIEPYVYYGSDIFFIVGLLYFWALKVRGHKLPSKLPLSAAKMGMKDPNNDGPGKNKQAEGILYLGNTKDTKEEIWFSSSDIKTHILYLGTTGAGKTEGLKSLVSNALCWGSGYVYVDGKADTGLWSSLSAMARRFGRDDDLLVLNYMTGNKDGHGASNTLNPFSGGSASYLTQLMVSLMPDAGGDNAMWKERAVALIGSVLPALTWRRDEQEFPLNVGTIREYLNLPKIISLSRNPDLPEKIKAGIKGYLDTLPGYVDEAFDDDGNEKPMPPDAPMVDTSTIHQQHGYLSMQFTRSLQSLADDYGYVFETECADIDMTDVVLNRRILVVLIPALEKSSDEAANLGKIVAATIKGMMGSTLGADVEGAAEKTIDNKPSESKTPFMTVFDEVGYYASQGMAVMAAQARSLGFCLVYAAQDLPAMEKRVKEEARSITANCNVKIFGKLEDPTQTKEFFEKTVGDILVAEVSGFQTSSNALTGGFHGKSDASVQSRSRASYDGLRSFKEGDAVVTFGSMLEEIRVFYSNPGNAKAMRVQKMLEPPKPDEGKLRQKPAIISFLDHYRRQDWSAATAMPDVKTEKELTSLLEGFKTAKKAKYSVLQCGAMALAQLGEMFMDDYPETKTVAPVAASPTVSAPAQPTISQETADSADSSGGSWSDMMSADSDDNEDDGGFSWGDVMSDDDETEQKTALNPADRAAAVEMLTNPPAEVFTQNQTQEEDSESGMSWSDLMGGDESDDTQNADLDADDIFGASDGSEAEEVIDLPLDADSAMSKITEELKRQSSESGDMTSHDIEQMLEDTNFYNKPQDSEPVEPIVEPLETVESAPTEEDKATVSQASFDLEPEAKTIDEGVEESPKQERPEGVTDEVEELLKSTAEELSEGLTGTDNPLDKEEKSK